ncbi:E3 ubiquitin-protein ligase HRD1 [Aspergillus clavatus NRRL 1]|uniref:RING-type E3 ubiquitin transferase n=1 Tax=Aspergillus clavatus (strain ATCC 1007 / CBS 513.65 / DSM 816 / NCTC 3887 / NRRL 1 / QM 1276 / 107) TaxID=344612 RepID=A1C428_ASPCL|nr:RING finger protein [Aspergillus clavatus NRRL 1]EAW15168.1 RING finger protein [Aspergillus clavatus NRRL 1]
MRLAAYAGASAALATGVVLKAVHQRANFYAACVYLSQSSANLMILTNLCLLIVGYLLFWLQRLLYGPLRPIETEQLYEKAWFAVTETCLAMTIFRGELGGWFLVMFVCLLVGKVWGWIGEGRVEFLEQQPPANPRLFHIRLSISLMLSVLFNSFMLNYCVQTVLEQARPDMMVMFGFEFAVLTILSSSTAARYIISLVELYINRQQMKAKVEERRREIRAARAQAHNESGEAISAANLPDENDIDEMELDVPGWEEKGRWIFYLDLLTDFLKLTVYLTFFAILFTFYGLPIHILRDVVVTIRSFGRRIMDFVRYRNATRDMNERYPDATAEEVTREDVCIICREEMTHWQEPAGAGDGGAAPAQPRARIPERLRPKKLPCGHILHFSCLRSWLERQQNCPTCRRPVIAPPRTRDHPGGAAGFGQADGAAGAQQNLPAGNQPLGQNGPAGNLPRARIYQFGPFRIGFGAGRGDLFRNLHQQIHQGNVPVQQNNNVIPPGARQIGFGLGFGRRAPAPVPQPLQAPTSSIVSIQAQLRQMEQQLMQEINNLRVTAEQLNLVRLLQAELQRLRNLPMMTPGDSQTTYSSVSPVQPSTAPFVASHRHLVSNPQAQSIPAGDSRLPEGLNLPEGWSLIPLHSPEAGSSGSQDPLVPTATAAAPAPEGPSDTPTQPAAENTNDGNSGTFTSARPPTPPPLPAWGFGTSTVAPDSHVDSSSQELENITTSAPAHDAQATTADEPTNSPGSKGKERVATVEDAVDEEA